MKETLAMCGFAAIPGLALVVHRAGLAHSVRCVGAWFYALAHGIEAGRVEFRRLADESRRAKA